MNECRVALVGAGPGDAGLLTLRAVECLTQADLVLYDRLVPPRLLDHAPAVARRICVDELPGCHPERWPSIYQTMIDAARAGQRVVRLKGGDPMVFGRGGEEAAALRAAGIAYEIVPGVTAALAAAAGAAIPLTHRDHASAVAFITGHEKKDGGRLDWPALARFPGTLVFYMGVGRLSEIVERLTLHGLPGETPASAVRWAGTNDQQTVEAPLAELPAAVERAGLAAPAVVIVGSVVALRRQLAWFEDRPLFGRRVLVTRPRHQAADLIARLERLGATTDVQPTVEIADPPHWPPVDRAIAELGSFHWLVFTSVNGVHCFLRRLRSLGRDLRALGHLQLAAIGPVTAEALRNYHLEPDVVPATFRSEELAEALGDRVAGQRVLLARADRGREILRESLANVADVQQVAVYSQVDVNDLEPAILERLRAGTIDFVTLTSVNIARSLLRHMDEASRQQITSGRVRLVTISPLTTAAVREFNLPVAAEAVEFTTNGVVTALCQLSITSSPPPEAARSAAASPPLP